jgi:hypothetical protein
MGSFSYANTSAFFPVFVMAFWSVEGSTKPETITNPFFVLMSTKLTPKQQNNKRNQKSHQFLLNRA